MHAGQYSEAARSYEEAAHLLPWRSELPGKAGSASYAAEQYAEAIRLLTSAAQQASLTARAWDELGSSYWAENDRARAISAWEAGSKSYPRDAALLERLAAAYHEQAAYQKEEAIVRDRLQLGQDATAHYRLGLLLLTSDPEGAAKELAEAAALDADFGPAAKTLQAAWKAAEQESDASKGLVVLARGLALVEEWGLAKRGFMLATGIESRNPEAWAWLGEAKQHLGEDGFGDLELALTLDGRDSAVRVLRGLYFRRQGKNREAVDEYLHAAQIEPLSAAIASSLGESYAASGDLVSALEAYQRATALAPADAGYWSLLASFCAENNVHVQDIGLPAARKAVAFAPKEAEVVDVLGWTYAQAGYLDEGRRALQQAIDLAPGLASPHVHLAVIYLRLGANNQALEELKLAVASDRGSPAAQSAVQLLRTYFPSFEVPSLLDTP